MGPNELRPMMVTEAERRQLRAMLESTVSAAGGMESRMSPDGSRVTIFDRRRRRRSSGDENSPGGAGGAYKLLFVKTDGEQSLVNSSSNVSLAASYSMPANSLAAGDIYRFTASGRFDWGASFPGPSTSAVLAVIFGSTGSAIRLPVFYQGDVDPSNETGDWAGSGQVLITSAGSSGSAKLNSQAMAGTQSVPYWDPGFGVPDDRHATSAAANNQDAMALNTTIITPISFSVAFSWTGSTATVWLNNLIIERMRAG